MSSTVSQCGIPASESAGIIPRAFLSSIKLSGRKAYRVNQKRGSLTQIMIMLRNISMTLQCRCKYLQLAPAVENSGAVRS